jgi:hypothetical protein
MSPRPFGNARQTGGSCSPISVAMAMTVGATSWRHGAAGWPPAVRVGGTAPVNTRAGCSAAMRYTRDKLFMVWTLGTSQRLNKIDAYHCVRAGSTRSTPTHAPNVPRLTLKNLTDFLLVTAVIIG